MKKRISVLLAIIIAISCFSCCSSAYAAPIKSTKKNTIISKWHICYLVEYKQPTCNSTGYSKYKCRLCKYTTTRYTRALGHNTVKDSAVVPTCTKSGFTEGSHCSRCKAVITEQKEIKPTGHSIETSVKKATPQANGEIVKACIKCGEVIEKEELLAPIGILLTCDEFDYDGNAKTPSVTVYNYYYKENNTYSTIDKSQYTVEYQNNVNVGTATVIVTLNSKYYEGTLNTTFTIKEAVVPPTQETTTVISKPLSFTPKITSIKNIQTHKIQLKFTTKVNVPTYTIQVSKYSNFSNATSTKVTPNQYQLASGTGSAVVFAGTPGKYYVRIKAGTTYSAAKSIRVNI